MTDKLRHAAYVVMAAGVMAGAPRAGASERAGDPIVKRGRDLITMSGCNDCHTPWKMGNKGPEQDLSRLLSGHPQEMPALSAPRPQGPWVISGTATMTAWAGPWGISYSANLTPDRDTGIGNWSAQNFIEAMRTGRHMGRGRPILPPMPWFNLANASDRDLKAIFAYLQTVPAIRNRVPAPVPPAAPLAGQEAPAAPAAAR